MLKKPFLGATSFLVAGTLALITCSTLGDVAEPEARRLNFDDLEYFSLNENFFYGADYKGPVMLSGEQDHTSGTGQSLKLTNRTKSDHRIKLVDLITRADLYRTLAISVWVYSPDADAEGVSLGLYGPSGHPNAFTPVMVKTVDVPQGVWTNISLAYDYIQEEIVQIGIDQRPSRVTPAQTLYLDDLDIITKKVEVVEGGYRGLPVRALEPAKPGRRPIPVSVISGKGYDDLLFYERDFAPKDTQTPEEKFQALPAGRVVADQNTLMSARVIGQDYGVAEQVEVSGMPFSKAWQITVRQTPPAIYNYQLTLPSLKEGVDFRDGDIMLLVFRMRTIETGMEDGNGKVQCLVEQSAPPNSKALQENVFAIAGQGWLTVYLPFKAASGYDRPCIRLGYGLQTVQFGGYGLINYEKRVKLSDLPSSSIMEATDGRELFQRDFQWRLDAWERIERIRKGDITVIVRDGAGNALSGTEVEAAMYEHEFQWGTAVGNDILTKNSRGDKYRAALSLLFNGGVLENGHKWVPYENDPGETRRTFDAVTALGLKYLRGHALMWDRAFPAGWQDNTSIPKNVYNLFQKGDKAGLDTAIKAHFLKITGDYRGQFEDWDVVNELLNNRAIRDRYGNGVLTDWFKWAREGAGPGTKLFINETGLTGNNQTAVNNFKKVLDYMRDNRVDFDGIGIQGHFGNDKISPESFYGMLEQFKEYGKLMKITEFDLGYNLSAGDREYEAGFTRDILIAAFSQENVNGFFMWGFFSGSHWLDNAPVFDANFGLKESGKQYIDLVYNKWWSRETGDTGADGACTVRGYYGDYDITVSANGKTKTVEARCYRDGDNTITVVLE
ncbi:MAG: endo-1,4-beta-xylanase [Treponema sp.]|jgi:GH35 family endo-1,4-beta-xylanase|nr:endo-1,4-beta-xylanase [Treponema sp.]